MDFLRRRLSDGNFLAGGGDGWRPPLSWGRGGETPPDPSPHSAAAARDRPPRHGLGETLQGQIRARGRGAEGGAGPVLGALLGRLHPRRPPLAASASTPPPGGLQEGAPRFCAGAGGARGGGGGRPPAAPGGIAPGGGPGQRPPAHPVRLQPRPLPGSPPRVKPFKGKSVHGDVELRVEQAQFSELSLAASTHGALSVSIDPPPGGLQVRPDFVLVREEPEGGAGGAPRRLLVGLHLGGVPGSDPLPTLYGFSHAPCLLLPVCPVGSAAAGTGP
ncbi:synapsin-2-like [Haemorhous mexicanus]|uniref:synapsin-2-like n=1 Tax=Haemorhous mexicanus TaxID=30427 RepID=UPI0028BF03F9|nr:synapsin-2-like [Haemorhous mexicanus]